MEHPDVASCPNCHQPLPASSCNLGYGNTSFLPKRLLTTPTFGATSDIRGHEPNIEPYFIDRAHSNPKARGMSDLSMGGPPQSGNSTAMPFGEFVDWDGYIPETESNALSIGIELDIDTSSTFDLGEFLPQESDLSWKPVIAPESAAIDSLLTYPGWGDDNDAPKSIAQLRTTNSAKRAI